MSFKLSINYGKEVNQMVASFFLNFFYKVLVLLNFFSIFNVLTI